MGKHGNVIKKFLKALFSLVFGSLGLLLLYVGFSKNSAIKNEDLKPLKGTLSNIHVQKRTGKDGKVMVYLSLCLNEYPGIVFNLPDDEYLHYNTTMEEDLQAGDTLLITIMDDDFERLISKTKPLNYWDKHGRERKEIHVFTVASKTNTYFDFKQYQNLEKKYNKIGKALFSGFGFLFVFCSLSMWGKGLNRLRRKYKKRRRDAQMQHSKSSS